MADRGYVEIFDGECKGCGLCIEACPPRCLHFAGELSFYGVHPAAYDGTGCTGCGICFYCCPEPGAIRLYRAKPQKNFAVAAQEPGYAGVV
jgi:NAD-dependent dihydropyrimidine dehydrogenase PreA subunit